MLALPYNGITPYNLVVRYSILPRYSIKDVPAAETCLIIPSVPLGNTPALIRKQYWNQLSTLLDYRIR